MKNDIKIKGSITLKKIDYKRILGRKVMKSGEGSSKIYLPKEVKAGTYVYVVIPEGK